MASYETFVKFIGNIERGLARFETIKQAAIKQKNNALRVKAENKISDWKAVKAKHIKSLNVSAGHGFTIRVISLSNKGLMVTVKHPTMKAPVTRHLKRKTPSLYTGKTPFGAELFIEYHVNFMGEVLNHPTMPAPMVKILPAVLKNEVQAA